MTNEKKVFQNVSAVQQPTEDLAIIGYLTWYSVGEDLYDREALRKGLLSYDISEDYLPNPIRSADAFRRATKAVETKRQHDKQNPNEYRNYIVRNVVNRSSKLQRNIVVETVNQKGEQLNYEPEGARLYFDKLRDHFSYDAKDLACEELAEEAEKIFKKFLTHHNGQAVRLSVLSYINNLSPTPVRPGGGIYFIPNEHAEKLRKIVGFVSSLDRGESYMVPLVNNEYNLNMVKDNVKNNLDKIVQQCRVAIHQEGEVPKWQIQSVVEEAKRIVKQFKDYRSIMDETSSEMETSVKLIADSIHLLLKKGVN